MVHGHLAGGEYLVYPHGARRGVAQGLHMAHFGIDDARDGRVALPALAGRQASGLVQGALGHGLAAMGPPDDHMRAGAVVGVQPDIMGRRQLARRQIALGVAAPQQGEAVLADKELHVFGQAAGQGPAHCFS